MNKDKQTSDTYLGDGVYASFDGWHIWLAANHHENKVIALESQVTERFMAYAQLKFPQAQPAARNDVVAELLEALQNLVDWAEALRASGDAGFWDWADGDEYTKARAAIAKAREVQP